MPQYAYTINGQRHLFEGPDPQTTAQFAQRWAATQPPVRTPVSANDNRPQPGPRRSQFALDAGARAKQDMADLTDAIAQVKAHPASLMNGPNILGAVSRYIPNALGLVPAAGVDQVTGPVVRGINSRFGTHFDPRYATDQILNGAGLLSGAGEASAAEDALSRAGRAPRVSRFSSRAGEMPAPRGLLPGPAEMAPQRPSSSPAAVSPPRVSTHIGKQLQLKGPTPKPALTVAYEAPELGDHVLGQNADQENVVPLSEGFNFNHLQRMKSLEDLPEDIQDKYDSAIGDLIINPILDDPDYGGHNSADIQYIRDELAKMTAEQRGAGGNARLADALDAANEDFRIMVNQQQPEMAKELGLTRPGDSIPSPSSAADPDVNQTGPRGELVNYAQHVAPPEGVDKELPEWLDDLAEKWPKERIATMLKAWKDIGETANDNDPLPNWAGIAKPKQLPILPEPEDFEPPTPLRDTMSPEEKEAWMKTAANDTAARDSDEYLGRYLPAVWDPPRAQLPAVWSPQRTQPPVVVPRPMNAFSGPTSLNWTVVPRGPRQTNGFDFNALRPPQWIPQSMVGAANQPQDSQQPQN
jgi:hypothetical protein